MLSWKGGAVDCRVVAAAGAFVLLRPDHVVTAMEQPPSGPSSLTYLDGMIPVGWDGEVEPSSEPGELRFRLLDDAGGADRRSSVRLPIFANADVTFEGQTLVAQLLDVSAGGIRFRQPGRLEAGSLLRVRAELPGGPVIDSDAVVRTSEVGATSAEFTAMHGATAQEIGAWTVARLRASLFGRS